MIEIIRKQNQFISLESQYLFDEKNLLTPLITTAIYGIIAKIRFRSC